MIAAGCSEETRYAHANEALLALGCSDLQADLMSGGDGWWVAWAGATPVGLVHLAAAGREAPTTGVIAGLYVVPSYRDRGVGRRLVEKAFLGARTRGWSQVYIYVAKKNPALGFYTRLGLVRALEAGLPGYVRLICPTTGREVRSVWDRKLIPFMLKAIAVALGLGSVVLGILKPERVERIAFSLGIGLVCLAISTLND
jgi:GNAT superfamily N-acetyltransferase